MKQSGTIAADRCNYYTRKYSYLEICIYVYDTRIPIVFCMCFSPKAATPKKLRDGAAGENENAGLDPLHPSPKGRRYPES